MDIFSINITEILSGDGLDGHNGPSGPTPVK